MPMPGREEQTLIYRVELDESSLSDVIRSARDAVGMAMDNAVNSGAGLATTAHLTAATAIARSTSHLDFLRQHTPGMGQHADTVAGAQGMSIARALGVKGGVVSPEFSETSMSLQYRADKRLRDALPSSLDMMETATSALSIAAGVGLMFIPGVGTAAGAAILGGQLAGDAALDAGFERLRNRKMLESHLLRLGKPEATRVVRGFEDQVRGMSGISFSEAAEVAAAAAGNLNTRTMSASAVEEALVTAVGDWRATGKALGIGKEASLATVGQMYRMGLMPGQVSEVVGGAAGLAQSMGGAQPHLVHQATMQFASGAQVQGFNAFAAANTFQLQAGSIAEMMRAGVIDRAALTQAAGFAGPVADQTLAAAQNVVGETMRMSQGSFGQLVRAGIAGGGDPSDIAGLGAAAMGMSTQQMLEFNANVGSMADIGAQQRALGSLARQVIVGAGGEVTQAALQSQLMGMGMSQGAAQVLAQQEMNPSSMGIARARQARATIGALVEGNGRAGLIGRAADSVSSSLGDAVNYAHSGANSHLVMAMSPMMLQFQPMMAAMNRMAGPGGEYRGFRGIADFFGDLFDTTYGEFGRDFVEAVVDPLVDPAAAARDVSGTVLTRRELDQMGAGGFRRLLAGVATSERDFRREFGDVGAMAGVRRIEALRQSQGELIREIRDSDPASRARLSGDVRRLRDVAGIEVSSGDMLKMVAQAQRFRDRMRGANEDERGKIQNELANTLDSMEMLTEGADSSAVAGFLLGDTIQTRLDSETAQKVVSLQQRDFIESAVLGATKSKEQRVELAQRIFGSTTSKAAKEFIAADGMGATQFRRMIEAGAGETGEGLSKEFRRSVQARTRQGMGFGNAAMLQLAESASMEAAEVRGERPSDPESVEGGGGGGGSLSGLIVKMDELISEIRADRRSRE